MTKRVLCIGDVHAHYDELIEMLNKIKYVPEEDILIFHGDYLDRGTQNLKTLYKIMELKKQGAICLRGNHEWFTAMALHDICFKNPMYKEPFELDNFYFIHGGKDTYDELMELDDEGRLEVYNFINNLPLYATLDKYIFVHGGINSNLRLEEHMLNEIVLPSSNWVRKPAYTNKVVVFGHLPTVNLYGYKKIKDIKNSKIWYDTRYKDKIGIDCGCGVGGRLACIDLVSGKEYYV
jgi:serine/threonine protein phosphatase 1